MNSPRVVIGAPVYNHEGEFREAIESILSQTFRDFRLVIVDDCSSDTTEWIAQEYARLDERIDYVRNERRLGMIDNWRRSFDVAVERWPQAEYFAWASDHDVWHPRWLAALVRDLDSNPNAVLAYPYHHRIAANSEVTDLRPWRFNTRGVTSRLRRFRRSLWQMSAGNMVYGLARARDIKACGVFRHVLVPDRLLMIELSLRGEFDQVPEVLWYRRFYGRVFSLGRQRQAFFPNGRPLYAFVPWWISHSTVLGWVYGVQRQGDVIVSRLQAFGLAMAYFWLAGLLHVRQQLKGFRIHVRTNIRQAGKTVLRPRRRRRAIEMALRQTRRHARAAASRVFSLGARVVRIIPIVGPRIVDAVHPPRTPAETGALDLLHLQRIVARLRRTTKAIIIGPFLSEPEYELLYWLPFVRWLQHEAALTGDQITVISRGGVSSWYQGISGRYVDVLNLISLAEVQARTQTTWREDAADRKLTPAAIDSHIIRRITRLHGFRKPFIVHPVEMQRLFRHVWTGAAKPDLVERHVIRQRLVPPPLPEGLDLPHTYAAVRIAFGPSFPDTPDNRTAARLMVERLSARMPLVLLNADVSLDGLEEFDPGPLPNIWRIASAITPATSLAVQSAVISRAALFAGSFGGFSGLAACYGVPGISVYSDTPGSTRWLIEALREASLALQARAVAVYVRDLESALEHEAPEGRPANLVP